MPWTTPETFTAGQTLTAASMNLIQGNLNVLHPAIVTSFPASPAEGDRVVFYNSTSLNYIPYVYAGSGPGWKPLSLGSNPPSVRCASDGTQLVTFLNQTIVLWKAADQWDTCSMHDTSANQGVVTIRENGIYAITCGIVLNAAPGGVFDIAILKNGLGGTYLAGTRGPDVDRTTFGTQAYLTTSDTVSVALYIQNDRTVGSNPISHLSVTMIGRT